MRMLRRTAAVGALVALGTLTGCAAEVRRVQNEARIGMAEAAACSDLVRLDPAHTAIRERFAAAASGKGPSAETRVTPTEAEAVRTFSQAQKGCDEQLVAALGKLSPRFVPIVTAANTAYQENLTALANGQITWAETRRRNLHVSQVMNAQLRPVLTEVQINQREQAIAAQNATAAGNAALSGAMIGAAAAASTIRVRR